jgi:hypothetical protein
VERAANPVGGPFRVRSTGNPLEEARDPELPARSHCLPMRTCLALALAFGALGVALRFAVPVAPADASFHEVVRFYRSLERP